MLPPPEVGNATPAFSRFCSGRARPVQPKGSIARSTSRARSPAARRRSTGRAVSKSRSSTMSSTRCRSSADSRGKTRCRVPPRQRNRDHEHGRRPAFADSQLYMYVGKKDHSRGADVLNRNGLNNGKLYAFRSKDPSRNSEEHVHLWQHHRRMGGDPECGKLTDVQLEAASDARNAFGFIRTEDGAWSKTSRKDYYFCTTGDASQAGNRLGPALSPRAESRQRA